MPSESSEAPKARLCHIVKAYPEEEYGFNLHAEKGKGQYIGKVDEGSPAHRAGLQQDDRIIAVNGQLVESEGHRTVVTWIKENPTETRMHVLTEDEVNWYKERGQSVPLAALDDEEHFPPPPAVPDTEHHHHEEEPHHHHHPEDQEVPEEEHHHHHDDQPEDIPPPDYETEEQEEPEESGSHHHHHEEHSAPDPLPYTDHIPAPVPAEERPLPRLCSLSKQTDRDEYGFNLHAESGKGHFIGKVDDASIAAVAGLVEGQRIVGINGTLIYPDSPHKDVISLIKSDPMQSHLLVAFTDVDQWHRDHGRQFSFEHSERYPARGAGETTCTGRMVDEVAPNGFPESHHHDSTAPEPEPNLPTMSEPRTSYYDSPVKSYVSGDDNDRNSEGYSSGDPPAVPEHHHKPDLNGTAASHHNGDVDDLFNLSAAELRERLAGRRKKDPRNQELSFAQKHDIIRNL